MLSLLLSTAHKGSADRAVGRPPQHHAGQVMEISGAVQHERREFLANSLIELIDLGAAPVIAQLRPPFAEIDRLKSVQLRPGVIQIEVDR